MGAWDELDTEISAEVETSDLEKIIDLDDPYGIFDDAKEYAEKLVTAIEKGTSKGLEEIVGKLISYQEQFINENCDNPSGMLAGSIDDEETGEYSYLVGTRINNIYPMSIEYGHTDIYPVRAKALAFYYEGELIFRKHVRETDPRPFVAPAYEKTDQGSKDWMLAEIMLALNFPD